MYLLHLTRTLIVFIVPIEYKLYVTNKEEKIKYY